MRKRDSQRSKVYRSEREAGIGNRRDWDTLEDCERFMMKVLNSNKFPYSIRRDIVFLCHHNRIDACAIRESNRLEIHLPLWARSKAVVLHELAHLVIDARLEWHGEAFCDVYLQLLKLFCKKGLAEKLKEKFLVNGVRFTKEII